MSLFGSWLASKENSNYTWPYLYSHSSQTHTSHHLHMLILIYIISWGGRDRKIKPWASLASQSFYSEALGQWETASKNEVARCWGTTFKVDFWLYTHTCTHCPQEIMSTYHHTQLFKVSSGPKLRSSSSQSKKQLSSLPSSIHMPLREGHTVESLAHRHKTLSWNTVKTASVRMKVKRCEDK